MSLLHLDALPPRTTKGTIVRLLTQVGGLDRTKIGVIEVVGRSAKAEVPDTWAARLVRALDGSPLGEGHIRAWAPAERNGHDEHEHFARLLRLLRTESEAEARQLVAAMRRTDPDEAERSGRTLLRLVIREEYAGLGGRILVTLGRRDPLQPLPWTRLDIGAPVLLSEEGPHEGMSLRGIVSDRDRYTIQVATGALPDPQSSRPTFRIDAASDEVGRQRQEAALARVEAAGGDRLAQLRDVLLGSRAARFAAEEDFQPLNSGLNRSQLDAIRFALAAEDVAILHGPPGTGKTTTVVELICQAIARGEKVLACAPSNLAVDNLLERLIARGQNAVRLGHPARVLPELRAHTLDLMVDDHPDVRLAQKLTKEAYALRDRANRFTRAKPAPGEKRGMRQEAGALLADARRLESQVVRQILDSATVLCVTLTGLDSELLGQRQFDLAVIDEASQTTEPACWIPVVRTAKLVLAGDHCQLPPTVVSSEAAREGFATSLMERLVEQHGDALSRRLTVQYRMHEAIMQFSSSHFYDSSLVAHESVREHLLCDLPDVAETELTITPLLFIDTAGAGYDESQEADSDSRLNVQEAELVVAKAQQLLAAGLAPQDLAIIAPYSAQVRHLRQQFDVPGLEIDTVDGFQGREKQAVLISLVRSNPQGEIGFLADTRRMNVALTRARRKLILIGDSATIGPHPFYARLLEYFEQQGAYSTVWEEAI